MLVLVRLTWAGKNQVLNNLEAKDVNPKYTGDMTSRYYTNLQRWLEQGRSKTGGRPLDDPDMQKALGEMFNGDSAKPISSLGKIPGSSADSVTKLIKAIETYKTKAREEEVKKKIEVEVKKVEAKYSGMGPSGPPVNIPQVTIDQAGFDKLKDYTDKLFGTGGDV